MAEGGKDVPPCATLLKTTAMTMEIDVDSGSITPSCDQVLSSPHNYKTPDPHLLP